VIHIEYTIRLRLSLCLLPSLLIIPIREY